MAKAKVSLTNVEYIALKMQAHPGQSGRFYRAALLKYRKPKWAKIVAGTSAASDHYSFYFRRASYCRGEHGYWVSNAPHTVFDPMPFLSERGSQREKRKPRKSSWHLTRKGWDVANRARRKLGLEEIAFPDRQYGQLVALGLLEGIA